MIRGARQQHPFEIIEMKCADDRQLPDASLKRPPGFLITSMMWLKVTGKKRESWFSVLSICAWKKIFIEFLVESWFQLLIHGVKEKREPQPLRGMENLADHQKEEESTTSSSLVLRMLVLTRTLCPSRRRSTVTLWKSSYWHLFAFHNVCFMIWLPAMFWGYLVVYGHWPMHFCKAPSWKSLWIKASAKCKQYSNQGRLVRPFLLGHVPSINLLCPSKI